MEIKWRERKKKGKNKGKNRKNKLKLVKKFRLRHTIIFCYGEENSAKNFRGGEKKSNLSTNILPCFLALTQVDLVATAGSTHGSWLLTFFSIFFISVSALKILKYIL